MDKFKEILENENLKFPILFIDTETTGFSHEWCDIIELGFVFLEKNGRYFEYSKLFKPKKTIPPAITKITGIANFMVCDKKHINFRVGEIYNYFENAQTIVGHNVGFDLRFLNAVFERFGKKIDFCKKNTIDNLKFFRDFFKNLKSKNLKLPENKQQTSLADFFKIKKGSAHRALDDVLVCIELFIISHKINKMNNQEIEDFIRGLQC